ncbi:MAG: EamA family transporter, partial [Gammaproteobacteria bacterium]
LVTALLGTAFAFSIQNWAQKFTPPAHTALIFTLEPVFAALTSWLLAGERFGGNALVGSALMLTGMVISELWGSRTPSPVEG